MKAIIIYMTVESLRFTYQLIEIFTDTSHPEYDDMLEWIGDDFDVGHFDLALTNYLLRQY